MNDRNHFLKPVFEDIGLQVGTRLQLCRPDSEEPQAFFSTLIGYVPGEYVLVKLPRQANAAASVREGQRIAARVFSGVSLYSFRCQVESVSLAPYFYMHLSYPHDIRTSRFRNEVRVNVALPAQVSFDPCEPAMEAISTLTDLSVGGAPLVAHLPLGEIGGDLHCRFELHTRSTDRHYELKLQCRIRSISPRTLQNEKGDMQWSHGVQFIGVDPSEHALLQNFVAERLLTSRNMFF